MDEEGLILRVLDEETRIIARGETPDGGRDREWRKAQEEAKARLGARRFAALYERMRCQLYGAEREKHWMELRRAAAEQVLPALQAGDEETARARLREAWEIDRKIAEARRKIHPHDLARALGQVAPRFGTTEEHGWRMWEGMPKEARFWIEVGRALERENRTGGGRPPEMDDMLAGLKMKVEVERRKTKLNRLAAAQAHQVKTGPKRTTLSEQAERAMDRLNDWLATG